MKKQITSLLVCGLLGFGAMACAAGCGSKGDVIELTVWASAAQEATFKEMVEEFKKANPDKNYNIKVGIGEEDMAYSNVSKDVSAAADVYCYANDQLIPLLRAGALARIGGTNLEFIKSNNSSESIESGSVYYGTDKEEIYGYPYASDSGCFLMYDKSVITEEQTATLEGIIAACENKNKQIGWALDVPWYTAGWFFTFGCDYSVEYDYKNNFKETAVGLEGFNGAEGIKASKAMHKLASSKAFAGKSTDNSTITDKFGTGAMAAAVTGTWLAKSVQEKLGANYGVCKLPTVTVDGETKQLASFKGYKLLGVNSHCENPAEAHRLAKFLSSEAMQKVRFDKHLTVPTNNAVSALDEVKNDATVKALNKQNAFAVDQVSVPSNFWEPLKSYGLNIIDNLLNETGSGGKLSYQERLNKMVELMKSSIN